MPQILLPDVFSNNGTKVRIFGEITKFLGDFFCWKSNFFLGEVSHFPTFPLLTFVFSILLKRKF